MLTVENKQIDVGLDNWQRWTSRCAVAMGRSCRRFARSWPSRWSLHLVVVRPRHGRLDRTPPMPFRWCRPRRSP